MTRPTILDGRAAAARLQARLVEEVRALGPPPPVLAVVLVSDEPLAHRQVDLKERAAAEVGVGFRRHELTGSTPQEAVEAVVQQLADDDAVHGLFVQLPLPPGVDLAAVVARIPPGKDVDGLTGRGALPATPAGILRLLHCSEIAVEGRRAVVVGRSAEVALPTAALLSAAGADVHVVEPEAVDPSVTRRAAILVGAAGQPGLLTGDHVAPGAVVVDAAGDVERASVEAVAGALVPMPGGVGPMTVAILLEHTVAAAGQRRLDASTQ